MCDWAGLCRGRRCSDYPGTVVYSPPQSLVAGMHTLSAAVVDVTNEMHVGKTSRKQQ